MEKVIVLSLELNEFKQIITDAVKEVLKEEPSHFNFGDKYPALLTRKEAAKILGVCTVT